MKESEIQNVELPTWFIMDSKGGDDWLRPSHPMSEEREVDEHERGVSLIGGRVAAIHSSQIAG